MDLYWWDWILFSNCNKRHKRQGPCLDWAKVYLNYIEMPESFG